MPTLINQKDAEYIASILNLRLRAIKRPTRERMDRHNLMKAVLISQEERDRHERLFIKETRELKAERIKIERLIQHLLNATNDHAHQSTDGTHTP